MALSNRDQRPLPAHADPAEAAVLRESIRLAFVAALQHLPPRQRAALILAEVLGWSASEIADALDTSVASVDSALQRARATLAERNVASSGGPLTGEQSAMLGAFEAYDVDALAALLREDGTFSMPPYELWLRGRAPVRAWLSGRGAECRGSRLLPTSDACGSPAFGQYRRDPAGGHKPFALVVLELNGPTIAGWNSFLDVDALFPLFGLPLHLDA